LQENRGCEAGRGSFSVIELASQNDRESFSGNSETKKRAGVARFSYENDLDGSDVENIHQFLNGGGRLMQCGAFVVREVDLDDLLDAVFAKFDRNADE
jgi:hypothetical protein